MKETLLFFADIFTHIYVMYLNIFVSAYQMLRLPEEHMTFVVLYFHFLLAFAIMMRLRRINRFFDSFKVLGTYLIAGFCTLLMGLGSLDSSSNEMIIAIAQGTDFARQRSATIFFAIMLLIMYGSTTHIANGIKIVSRGVRGSKD